MTWRGSGISAPMARALARAGHDVVVSQRNRAVSGALAAEGLGIRVAENNSVVEASDVVFLCLRPAVWREVVAGLAFREGQQVVSVMAGVSLATLADACAPAERLSLTIPYGFVEHGGCPLPVAGDAAALQALFGPMNPVLPVAEEAIPAHFAASTLVTGVLEMLQTGAGWLAGRTGNAEAAEVYVARLVTGFLENTPVASAGRLAEEKHALATPGTLNLRMAEGIGLQGLPDLLDRIEQSMDRRDS